MHREIDKAFNLDGRVAVVTGAASGISREIACVLAAAGARLLLADIQERGLDETASLIAQAGVEAMTQRTDVTLRGDMEALAARAVAETGRLDIWVNGAGIIVRKAILEATEMDLETIINVNLKGVYWGCVAAGRAMKQNGSGSIINISSAGGETVNPGISIYALTKAAVNMLTRTVALEFGAFGIRANAVAPGWVETPLVRTGFLDAQGAHDDARRDAVVDQVQRSSPLGFVGTPRDIGLTALYLASDASRFMTGQILRPNGGVHMP